jgi:hypothetical protein
VTLLKPGFGQVGLIVTENKELMSNLPQKVTALKILSKLAGFKHVDIVQQVSLTIRSVVGLKTDAFVYEQLAPDPESRLGKDVKHAKLISLVTGLGIFAKTFQTLSDMISPLSSTCEDVAECEKWITELNLQLLEANLGDVKQLILDAFKLLMSQLEASLKTAVGDVKHAAGEWFDESWHGHAADITKVEEVLVVFGETIGKRKVSKLNQSVQDLDKASWVLVCCYLFASPVLEFLLKNNLLYGASFASHVQVGV